MDRFAAAVFALCAPLAIAQSIPTPWNGYGNDPQHTGISTVTAQPLSRIKWSTAVDTVLQGQSGPLYVHYGTPVITVANTVLVPQRTSTGFQINAFKGSTGALLFSLPTDYVSPPHDWVPSYGASLVLGKYYYPGAAASIFSRNLPDSGSGTSTRLTFYGASNYSASLPVWVSTPITTDRAGNIYFGFLVANTVTMPGGSTSTSNSVTLADGTILTSGLARISATGQGSWISASALAGGDPSITHVAMNCAPAVNALGNIVYVAVNSGNGTPGYLTSVSASLAPIAHTRLVDPNTQQYASILDDSSAAPTIGPDGDVYYGVFETSCCSNHDRGWLLHFDSTLSIQKLPGAFGWDTTASIVPKSLVPSYTGSSSYLLLTKYNNYVQTGGNGQNFVAVTDPNNPMVDPITGINVMNVVIEQLGHFFDNSSGTSTSQVPEWCINSAAIDPISKSAIINSENGWNYRWNLATNTLSQFVQLTSGVAEAYTPTVIGPDGTVYAINDATLYAIGQ